MELTNARVLVAGGAGFVGSNLIPRLVDRGARVRATIYRRDPIHPHPAVEYVRADLEQPGDCERVCRDMDIVVVAAANSSGAGVMATTPLVHLTPNVIMNARLLEAAYAAGVRRLVFISSNTVYPLTDFPVRESDVTHEFYETYFIVGWMKRFSEIMCEMYSSRIKRPMTTIVLRPGNMYGPYDKFGWKTSKVIAALVRRVVERHDPIEVWGDGRDLKDFIYVDDFVEGMLLALEKLDGHETLNIASGQPVTIREVLDTLMRVEGCPATRVRYDETKPTMIPKRLIDIAKARDLLGFRPAVSLEEGLRRTAQWYRHEGCRHIED